MEPADYTKVFKFAVYVTSFTSLLYVLQPIIGTSILQMSSEQSVIDGDGVARYYNLPFLIAPVMFLLFFNSSSTGILFKNLLLAINASAILLSQHRNYIASVIICFLVFAWKSKTVKSTSFALYILLGIVGLVAVDGFFNNRLSKGLSELTESAISQRSTNKLISLSNVSSTTEFRTLHFAERFDYVNQDPLTFLFGIGLINEDAPEAQLLSFNIGAETEYGEVLQVYTDDIAWSMILLQLGVTGLLLLTAAHCSLFYQFFQGNHKDPLIVGGMLFVLFVLMTSFYGNMIIAPYAVCLLMLFCSYHLSLGRRKPHD
jgi:hypothetical protein